jgi:type I restriction enzyme, S subunit
VIRNNDRNIWFEKFVVMKTNKFSQILDFQKKSHIKAGDGLIEGAFPFFTSSPLLSKYINISQFDSPSLVFGTGGNASVHMSEKPFSVSTDCLVAQLKYSEIKNFEIKFIYYYLSGNISILENGFKGAGLKHISKGYINNIDIPEIPIKDQKRIVKILDQADALRQKRKQAIALLDEYVKSVFLEMFGDPVSNPKGWPKYLFGNLISEISSGTSYSGEKSEKLGNNELGVLKISSVTSGIFNPSEFKAVKKDNIKSSLITVKKGDFLFSRANTRELVAACCIVDKNYEHLFLPDKLWRITFDNKACLPDFINYLLKVPKFRENLTKQATGTSGSMLNISMGKFKKTDLYLPPLYLQELFSSNLRIINSLNQKMLQQSQELENQFQALMQKAFKGEL